MEKTKNVKTDVKLRTIDDLLDANEWVYNGQRSGTIDSARASGLNQTLKNSRYLLAELPLAVAKLAVQAAIRKVDVRIPPQLVPFTGEITPQIEEK